MHADMAFIGLVSCEAISAERGFTPAQPVYILLTNIIMPAGRKQPSMKSNVVIYLPIEESTPISRLYIIKRGDY